MMNQKIKNIIVILIVLALGFWLFSVSKNNHKGEVVIDQGDEILIGDEDQTVDSVEDVSISKPSNDSVKADNDKKFNEIMAKAQEATLKNNYNVAIEYYNQAIKYKPNDSAPYAGLYVVYLNQKNWQKALDSVNGAIKTSPIFGDYWNWKILVMNEGLNKSYAELKAVYDEGYPKVRTQEKVNLVTKFAQVSENLGQKTEAIKLWQKAIEINPEKTDIYQAEVDRILKK